MYPPNLSTRLVRALAPPRFAAGVLVTLALLASACSDSASRMLSPSLLSSSAKSASPSASNFAVLANAAVTCTGGTITGDVGTNQSARDLPPGSVTQTGCTVSGNVHVGDGAAKQAFNDFLSTFGALATTACTQTLTGTTFPAELMPGVICFPNAVTSTGGTLTLSGNGIFLIRIGSDGSGALTATNFNVVLTNGAQACNVIFLVANGATLTSSTFQGSILAGGGITLTDATLNGNAFSKADVTVTRSTVTGCEGSRGNGNGNNKQKCNQGVGNGPEGCDPGNSNNRNPSNDENGGTPGNPGRKP